MESASNVKAEGRWSEARPLVSTRMLDEAGDIVHIVEFILVLTAHDIQAITRRRKGS